MAWRVRMLAVMAGLALAACEPAAEDKPAAPAAPTPEASVAPEPAPEAKPEPAAAPAPAASASKLAVDHRYKTLGNGLKVVLARDTSTPTVTVSFFVNVGFRTEAKDRSGFSHLFEHILFEETENLENGEFDRIIEGAGGVNNGYTSLDQTGYWAVVPAHLLETMLWVEADRLARVVINDEVVRNQSDIVQNELKVRSVNQPYGGFAWVSDWLMAVANVNAQNQRDIEDELADVAAAQSKWALEFYKTYYAPNNVALVVVGDLDYDETMGWVEKYFGPIPSGPPVVHPDVGEPAQLAERRGTRADALAPRPALSFAYRSPARGAPEHIAMGVLDQILAQGDDSRLHRALVVEGGFASGLVAGLGWGDLYDQNGPTLWTVGLIHDPETKPDDILAAAEKALAPVLAGPLPGEEIERARVKLRAQLYGLVDSGTRSGLASLLGSLALYDDDPGRINRLEDELAAVTPELVHKTAVDVLKTSNRSVLTVTPAAKEPLP